MSNNDVLLQRSDPATVVDLGAPNATSSQAVNSPLALFAHGELDLLKPTLQNTARSLLEPGVCGVVSAAARLLAKQSPEK